MKMLFIITILLVLQTSCKQTEVSTDSSAFTDWTNCREVYNMTDTQRKIVGSWTLKGIRCGFCQSNAIEAPKTTIELRVSAAGEALVYENNTLVATEQIKLKDSPVKGYYMFDKTTKTKESVYTNGYIEFCGDKMALRNSYMDGADYFFIKN